jgi:hypothetical protein
MAAARKWNLPADTTLVVLDGGSSASDLIEKMDVLVGWCRPDLCPNPLSDDEYQEFAEPDLNGEHTGFAVKPGCAPKWLKSLPLLFAGGGEQQ